MSRHDAGLTVRQMLGHAREGMALAKDKVRSDLDVERTLTLSLIYLVQTIGEAAKRLSPEDRERWSHVSWHRLTGMRNRLIHGYDSIDHDALWDTLTDDLPPLIAVPEQVASPSESG